jgi:hypothetical protein
MRRTAPVKRTFQVIIAVDKSQSMPLIGAADSKMLWCYAASPRAAQKKGGKIKKEEMRFA